MKERLMAYGNYIGEPTSVLVKREHFLDLGGFDERFFYMGDIQFWCRLLASHDLYYYPVPLCKFRYHEEQKSEEYKQDIDKNAGLGKVSRFGHCRAI